MYHLRFKGRHYEMGVKRGRLLQKAGIVFPLRLDAFQLRHGEESERELRKYFPEVCEEIRGVSDSIGADYLRFASWMLCMGCCMYNLEDNIPVEIRGCTAFAFEREGRILYGRNNDLPPYLREGSKSEIYMPADGNRFSITTSSFINGEEGINEHGLAVAMTFVMTDPGKIRAGFNSCFLVRFLLEKASNTEEALSMLKGLPAASNCNILLADRGGRMAVVECTPDRKHIREAESAEEGFSGTDREGTLPTDGRLVCAVNSFISREMRPWDDGKGRDYDAARRYRTVLESFPGQIRGDLLESAKRLLRGEFGFICQYDGEPDFETVWSSVFDLQDLRIYRAEGDPRKKKFVLDARLHDLVLETCGREAARGVYLGKSR